MDFLNVSPKQAGTAPVEQGKAALREAQRTYKFTADMAEAGFHVVVVHDELTWSKSREDADAQKAHELVCKFVEDAAVPVFEPLKASSRRHLGFAFEIPRESDMFRLRSNALRMAVFIRAADTGRILKCRYDLERDPRFSGLSFEEYKHKFLWLAFTGPAIASTSLAVANVIEQAKWEEATDAPRLRDMNAYWRQPDPTKPYGISVDLASGSDKRGL